MKACELREKSLSDLKTLLEDTMLEFAKLNLQLNSGQLKETHVIKTMRRNIARIKTTLNQKNQES